MDREKVEWVPVEGYVGRYAVNATGEVLSMDYRQTGIPGLLKPRVKRGYHFVNLMDGRGKTKTHPIHRLVAHAFLGARPDGLQINHKSGVKSDNRVENLEYITPGENTRHAIAAGLAVVRGSGNNMAKFTDAEIVLIRKYRMFGVGPTAIARHLGVNRTCIQKIVRGETWAHVTANAVEGE